MDVEEGAYLRRKSGKIHKTFVKISVESSLSCVWGAAGVGPIFGSISPNLLLTGQLVPQQLLPLSAWYLVSSGDAIAPRQGAVDLDR